ncbi:DUF3224 domain-containing protein [Streptomyces sp. DSM 44915]|uniref:DUF3224 domain-containing protein n=1 Tax=Streptomyces chisholmiae TaxID=3075540 RepID=A0ABU2JNA1_9ACTN|nr:DUF3224 domain-containing protein [Streptomyces sp. DSM 44915]MDT0266377.1 DUF3224 domain-containing protein [Streptomyces sp. DSM 44915]
MPTRPTHPHAHEQATTGTTAETTTESTTGATRRAVGTFGFADWRERPLGPEATEDTEDAKGTRLAHASVRNSFSGDIEAADTLCEYTVAYTPEGTGGFAGLELVTGTLAGLAGAFVLEERGTFTEHGTVDCAFTVVPGSGTGALTGLAGTGSFVHRPGQRAVPYTFDYSLPGDGRAS